MELSSQNVEASRRKSAQTNLGNRVAVVIVDYKVGDLLAICIKSILREEPSLVVVVDNSACGSSRQVLGSNQIQDGAAQGCLEDLGNGVSRLQSSRIILLEPGINLGYGSGANRGVSALGAVHLTEEVFQYVLICNSDIEIESGALASMVGTLDTHPTWALVGPQIVTPQGEIYPSVREFPSMIDAVGHALLAIIFPNNRFTRRYRALPISDAEGESRVADWISGACMLVRISALEELGGFDESYFMFAEDMDLCWRAREIGWKVGFVPQATVMHVHGASTIRHPYKMIFAHHRSALHFAYRTTKGWRRLLLPIAAGVLALRLAMACVNEMVHGLHDFHGLRGDSVG